MSKAERSWKEHVRLAKHYRALGQAGVYLSGGDDETDRPWHLVTNVRPGGTHRLDMDTSIWFEATDPKSGLGFRWTVEIEDRDANGHGYYKINTKRLRRILAVLPPSGRMALQKYLADAARKVKAKGDEWAVILKRQQDDAATLALLATEPTP